MWTHDAGWVNAYEQSKYEAEAARDAGRQRLGRFSDRAPSSATTLPADVTQVNAVHRALQAVSQRARGDDAWRRRLDRRRGDDVVRRRRRSLGSRYATTLAGRWSTYAPGAARCRCVELLDITWERWASSTRRGGDAAFRRPVARRPARRIRCSSATIEEIGDPSLKRVARALSHFVPQLAMPKRFDTTNADSTARRCGAPPFATSGSRCSTACRENWGGEP